MTRKDYIVLARVQEESMPYDPHAYLAWRAQCTRLANALKADNPNFDHARFIKACGVPVSEGVRT